MLIIAVKGKSNNILIQKTYVENQQEKIDSNFNNQCFSEFHLKFSILTLNEGGILLDFFCLKRFHPNRETQEFKDAACVYFGCWVEDIPKFSIDFPDVQIRF
jgi:hypothetical protein